MTGLVTRVLPARLAGRRRARYVIERNLLLYRRVWLIILSGFFEPLFYLFAVGVGIGQLVGDVAGPGGEPVSYAAFVAPGLLAASAMNGAVYESTNVFFKFRYGHTYKGMMATPVNAADVALGEITWSQFRGLLYAAGFLVVMVALGLIPSPWGVLALPAATLVGFAFAAVGMAATTFMRSYLDFDLVQLATLPLFLFSATFFGLDIYPPALRWVVQLSPLYHGVALLRSLTLGALDWSLLGHCAFLVAMGLVGMAVAARRLERLLLS